MFSLRKEGSSGHQKQESTVDQALLAKKILPYGYRIVGAPLQSGRFSDVFTGVDKQGIKVAIKAHKMTIAGRSWKAEGQFNREAFQKEVSPDCREELTITDCGCLGVSILDWVEGKTLLELIAQCSDRKRRDEAPLLARELVDKERQLQKVHILQADKKPANLIGKDVSHLQVIDYGTSFWHHQLGDIKEIHGTPSYMTQDQLTGNLRPTSDQEAIFYILFEMLIGKRMFPEKIGKQKISTVEVYNRRFLKPDPHHDPWKGMEAGYGKDISHRLRNSWEMLTDPKEQEDRNLIERFLASFLQIFPDRNKRFL